MCFLPFLHFEACGVHINMLFYNFCMDFIDFYLYWKFVMDQFEHMQNICFPTTDITTSKKDVEILVFMTMDNCI
jgi:hypothetical protein